MSQERQVIDHELLLAQAGWVRGLAGTLVRDPVGADDVAQETLLAALVSPPRRMEDERTLRAWLARVVTNLARLAARRNVRRERREEFAARPEEVAPAHETVERAAMLQRVLDSVLELDEPYRSTVLLRFFDGLDSDEIGKRTGASAVAVRKRLSRGLERLRKKLDQEHGGDRQAWRSAFLPWALARPEASAIPAGLPGGGLAGASGGLHAALAAAAVLALAGTSALVAASLEGRGGRAASPQQPVEAALADLPATRRAATMPASPPLPPSGPRSVAWIFEVPLEDAQQPGPTTKPSQPVADSLAGRVVDLAGVGLAGASLRVGSGPRVATSALDGSFTIALDGEPSDHAGACVVAEAPGVSTLRAALLPATPWAPGRGDRELLVVASPAVDLSGLVVDASGAPVSGAHVALDVPDAAFADLWLPLDGTQSVPRGATTDEFGRFELPDLATHPDLALVVSARGLPELRVPVPAHSVDGLCLRFPGQGPAWLEGLVLLPGGLPATGARVRAGGAWALADGRGRYRVAVDPARPPPLIMAELPGWLPVSKALGGGGVGPTAHGGGGHAGASSGSGEAGGGPAAAGAEKAILLQIQGQLLSIPGRALQAAGVPAAGWNVVALDDGFDPRHPERPAGAVAACARSAADGSFVLEGLLDRSYRVLAFDPASGLRAGPEEVLAGSTADLVAQGGARPSPGRLLADGRPMAEATVVPVLASAGGFLAVGPVARTDATGGFVLPGSAGWEGLLLVEHPSLVSAALTSAGKNGSNQTGLIHVPEDAWFVIAGTGLDPAPDALSVLDAAGTALAIHTPSGSVERLRLSRGRSPVVRVADTGTTLVLYRGGLETLRWPLHLVGGEISVVRGPETGARVVNVAAGKSAPHASSPGGPSDTPGGSSPGSPGNGPGAGKPGGPVTGPGPRQP